MSKNKDKNKFKDNLRANHEEAKTVRKIVSIVILTLILIIALSGLFGYIYIKSALEPVDPNNTEEIEVEIPLGSSSSQIANILEEHGIIKNGFIFRFYIKFNNISDFQAGNYTFTQAMTLDEIIDHLHSGKLMVDPLYSITVPEGLTIEQIAEVFAEELYFTKEEFLEVANDQTYVEELIEKYPTILTDDILNSEIIYPLEGYLFAATYSFYEEQPSIEFIIEEMIRQTETIVAPYMEEFKEKNLSIHEAITFASIIEKETGKIDQRDQIASIFYNRLEEGMPLQTDPTVAYAVGEHLDRTLYEHTEEESPYNTYQITGLPVGPISNFAKTSLEAVVEPEESDYLYFLHDSEGNIHFARTLNEHIENRNHYLDND